MHLISKNVYNLFNINHKTNMNIRQPLTQAQMMVLSLVNNSYSETDLNDLRNTLLQFNHQKMQNHLDKIVSKNQINDAIFDKILNSHDRKTK